MDFADTATLSVRPREGTDTVAWPAVLRVDRDTFTETALPPVTSYEDAQSRMLELSADRLYVPADVLADMIAVGAGPGV
jgi:hypothetical protein